MTNNTPRWWGANWKVYSKFTVPNKRRMVSRVASDLAAVFYQSWDQRSALLVVSVRMINPGQSLIGSARFQARVEWLALT